MCYIELCNKKDRSLGSFMRQIRLNNVQVGSRFHRRQWECDKNSPIFKFKRIHLVYHIIDFFFKNRYFMPWDMWINRKQKKSLTTRFSFHVALDEQVQVGINLHNYNVIY